MPIKPADSKWHDSTAQADWDDKMRGKNRGTPFIWQSPQISEREAKMAQRVADHIIAGDDQHPRKAKPMDSRPLDAAGRDEGWSRAEEVAYSLPIDGAGKYDEIIGIISNFEQDARQDERRKVAEWLETKTLLPHDLTKQLAEAVLAARLTVPGDKSEGRKNPPPAVLEIRQDERRKAWLEAAAWVEAHCMDKSPDRWMGPEATVEKFRALAKEAT